MAESEDQSLRQLGTKTLSMCEQIHQHRHEFFRNKLDHSHDGGARAQQGIVPDILLDHLSKADDVDESVKKSAQNSIALSQKVRDGRQTTLASADAGDVGDQAFVRAVYDMETQGDPNDQSTMDLLPGKPVRLEGQAAVDDKAVNEAYDNALKVLQFYEQVFSYKSLNGRNMPVISSVHFAHDMGNAFWTSQKQQMVYGDGDGAFLYNFTATLDVIGHEMTHAVTEFNSRLQYQGESGALNEHISDAFGIMVKQWAEGEDAASADWLIGEGCLLPGVKGVALRNMKQPGTAYNDPRFGKDPQPANYKDIAVFSANNSNAVQRDHGGVHIFSGVPNSAFTKCALAFGGNTWDKAGQIWWTTVTTHRIPPNCTFIQFADATVDAAEELFGDDAAKLVRKAWNDVGVTRKH